MKKGKFPVFRGHKLNEEELVLRKLILDIMCSNLLSNAIKYSGEGKRIELRVRVTQKELVFSVTDRGIGIPYNDQENMFGRFFRAKNAANIQSTGLGLNIVSKYLNLLNGTITFENVPDEGTTFVIAIPNKDHA